MNSKATPAQEKVGKRHSNCDSLSLSSNTSIVGLDRNSNKGQAKYITGYKYTYFQVAIESTIMTQTDPIYQKLCKSHWFQL